ncbi:MAG: hypothetical protein B7Z37_23320 [Verrucomicrobia bacterium 12-59-8]|nr:MAG: hypothetical protein B7Z37_23320 [Verrucomicrobia bacterium 12-59-8]
MAELNVKKLMNEIADKINQIEVGLVTSPDMASGEMAYILGRLQALNIVWNQLKIIPSAEVPSSEVLKWIAENVAEVRKIAFGSAQVGENNFEEKKKLDFGKLSEYHVIAAHIKDRESKLEAGE